MLSRSDVRLPLRSPVISVWLFIVAALIALMVLVGGATRLTRSGLSITEWKPVTGIMLPGSETDWQIEFDKYRQTPQYKLVNAHMTIKEFKGIYGWEWFHRLLGRLIGLAAVIPFFVFLLRSEIPQRLIWRLSVWLGIGAFQGLIGWWMVQSGLENAVTVAPERLAIHLFTALSLMVLAIWFGLEALSGEPRGRGGPQNWRTETGFLMGLIFTQIVWGAIVAGNLAGFVYNDWPLMNGSFVPMVDWRQGPWQVLIHDPGAVQFIHRILAYIIGIYGVFFYATRFVRQCRDDDMKRVVWIFGILICLQICLGVFTLYSLVNIFVALGHQLTGLLCLLTATYLSWKVARADRDFM